MARRSAGAIPGPPRALCERSRSPPPDWADKRKLEYFVWAKAVVDQCRGANTGLATTFDKVYAQYKLAPEVTRRRMYYETMEQVLSKIDKTIVEAPGVTPYLPLPEVKKQQQEEAQQ